MKTEPPRLAVFQPGFIEDLHYWVATDRRTAKRLLESATVRQIPPGSAWFGSVSASHLAT